MAKPTTQPNPDQLPWTGNPAADRLIATDPLALLIGFVLDQQVTIEWAFGGPLRLSERLGMPLDAAAIASLPPERVIEVFRQRPALHMFPAAMAGRVHELCGIIARDYGGDAGAIWRTAADGAELHRRLSALPGFGDTKARIVVGVIGRRLGQGPAGWEALTLDRPSLADVDSPEALAGYRAWKRTWKAEQRAAKEATGSAPSRVTARGSSRTPPKPRPDR